MCDKYNGWVNYETWNIALWMGEVDGLQDAIDEQAKKLVEDNTDDGVVDVSQVRYELAKHIESVIEDTFFAHLDMDLLTGPAADAIGCYKSMIDEYEIARHYITDLEVQDDVQ